MRKGKIELKEIEKLRDRFVASKCGIRLAGLVLVRAPVTIWVGSWQWWNCKVRIYCCNREIQLQFIWKKTIFCVGLREGWRVQINQQEVKIWQTGTRKCECLFRLHSYFLASQEWNLTVVSSLHNHKLDKKLGHIIARHLKKKGVCCWNDKEFGPS
jgi:hypothetical protein